jgi:hypothetical protein
MASTDSHIHLSELEKACTIIGRSLALLCLQNTPLKDASILEKAEFLSGLGLQFADAAKMLGSTAESLRVMAYQKSRKPKGTVGGKKNKPKAKRRAR